MIYFFNRYNIMLLLIYLGGISIVPSIFTTLLLINDFFPHSSIVLGVACFIMFLPILCILTGLTIIGVDIITHLSLNIPPKICLKYYHRTWQARRFATQIITPTKNTQTISLQSSQNIIKKKVNVSLWSLTIEFHSDYAHLTWRFPNSYEAQQLILELLPSLKNELNYVESHFLFNDIIRKDNSRIFEALGYKRK